MSDPSTSLACSNGHLVVGFNPRRCPECYVAPKEPVWKTDPYVLQHIAMAKAQGLLSGPGLSEVQTSMLMASIILDRESEDEERQRAFEERLLITSPERFGEWQETKERMREQTINGDDEELEAISPDHPAFAELNAQATAILRRAFAARQIPDDEIPWKKVIG